MDRNVFGRQDYKNSGGFSLIGIIIFLAILLAIAFVIVMLLDPFMMLPKTRDNQRKTDLVKIQDVLQEFYKENGKYPLSNDKYEIVSVEADNPDKPWGSYWDRYHFTLPKDPDSKRTYRYISAGNEQSYYLYASLENAIKDPQACNKGEACAHVPEGVNCGDTDICNYGASSPNVSP